MCKFFSCDLLLDLLTLLESLGTVDSDKLKFTEALLFPV